jgi:hypothetical protein
MSDQALQFLLIAATVFGTIIAVLIGRALDKGFKKHTGIMGVITPKASDVIDFTQKNILLQPKNNRFPIERIFEKELIVANIGFDVVENFHVVMCARHLESYNSDIDFIDFSITTSPEGLNYKLEKGKVEPTYNETLIHFPFMNRGDVFKIRISSTKEVDLSFKAHHPNTEFRAITQIKLLPTLRQKIGSYVGSSKAIEVATVATAAVVAALIASLLGNL